MKPVLPALALVLHSAVAFASPDGAWRCKANGDIPIGILSLAGDSYEFTVVKNTVWDPKPGDPGNGSGRLAIDGPRMAPLDGPLLTQYESTLAYCGPAEGCSGDDIVDVINASGALMRCWRP